MTDVVQTRPVNHPIASDPTDDLLPLVYHELRRMASAALSREGHNLTLQPTALVHEAYMRLVGRDSSVTWDSRGHFFAAAAESMRRILIESARRKKALKRQHHREAVRLEHTIEAPAMSDDDLLTLDDALHRLESQDCLKAEIVKLRYFAGLSVEETAQALSISPATVKRHWAFARAWLFAQLRPE